MMLLSKYILDVKPYNEYGISDSWGKSSLREFLNGDFYDESFIDDEKRIIFKMPHIIDTYTYEDNIYIFDKNEYSGIFKASVINKENKLIATEGTPYAKAKGLYVKEAKEMWYDGNSLYWLGNINKENHFSETVEYNGYMSGYGVDQRLNLCGVRPVVCLCWEDMS